MCKYCEPDENGMIFGELSSVIQDAGVLGEFNHDLVIEKEHGDYIIASGFYNYLGSNNAFVEAKINYCPMCGRKLREVAE